MSKDEAFNAALAAVETYKAALAAEETYKAAVRNIHTTCRFNKGVLDRIVADNSLTESIKSIIAHENQEAREQEVMELVYNLKEIEYNTKSDEPEPKTNGGFATLCVLGASALAVAVPYLIDKFKKED